MSETTKAPTEPTEEIQGPKSGFFQLRELYRRVRGPVKTALNNSGKDLSDPDMRHALQSVAFDSSISVAETYDKEIGKLKQLVERDPLTHLLSRTAFSERVQEEASRIDRNGGSAVILVMDGVGIRKINTVLGHMEGDAAIIQIAAAIKTHKRDSDSAGRWGGDEFTLLLPNTNLVGAEAVWKKTNNALSEIKIGDTPISLAVRGGAVMLNPEEPEASLAHAIKMMEEAKRKTEGQNDSQKAIYLTPAGE